MSGFLLDTNILSDLVRNPQGRIAARIAEVGEEAIATSVVVAAELRFGAAKKRSERLSSRVEAILGALTVLPLEPPADDCYARIRLALEAAGTSIGGNDLLIAAHALAAQRIVVTNNLREFTRVPDLEAVNWL